MNARKKYRRFVCSLLFVSIAGLACCSLAVLRNEIPDRLQVSEAGELPQIFQNTWGRLITGREEGGESEKADGTADQGTQERTTAGEVTDFGLQSSSAAEANDSGGVAEEAGSGQQSSGMAAEADCSESVAEEAGSGQQSSSMAAEADSFGSTAEEAGSGQQSSTVTEASGSLVVEDSAGTDLTSEQAGMSGSDGSYEVTYSLFGKIPLKTVSVDVVEREKVYVGGTPIGIYLETDGVLVVDTGTIQTSDGSQCCPAENIVKSGDYIKAVNGVELNTKEELIACISQCGGDDLILEVERDGELLGLKIHPVLDENGEYKAGIWVRNDTQGIGTLTYVKEDGTFGALGHGISDVDTGGLLDIIGGTLYDAEVISIVRGAQGSPDELSGIIHYSESYKIGEITNNTANGIYGKIIGFPQMAEQMELYEVAYKQEIEVGEATILSSVSGELKEYTINITEVRLNGSDANKGMVLEVTDEELLELTGGIIQGMSGSPIIQNGRIVGAVTHVFVNDPTKGYGIFIENMLEQ